jgi:WD40 repeat protein
MIKLFGALVVLVAFCHLLPVNGEQFTPELVLQTGHNRPVVAVAISPDRRWLASGSQDSTVKIWDLSNGLLLRTLYGHSGKVNAVAISPDGQWIASAAEDFQVRLWEIATGNQAFSLAGHQNSPTAVAFSRDGRTLVSAAIDSVRIWDVATGREVRTIPMKAEDQSGRVTISPDGRFIVVGGGFGKPGTLSGGNVVRPLKVIDIATGNETATEKVDTSSPFGSIAFSPDGNFLAVRKTHVKGKTNEESIKIIQTQSGDERSTLKIAGEGTSYAGGAMAFSPDGKYLAAEGPLGGSLRASVLLFDLGTGQQIRELTTTGFFTPGMNLDITRMISNPLVFSPDTQLLALGGGSAIQLWNANTGKEVATLRTNLKAGAVSSNKLDPRLQEALEKSGATNETMEMGQEAGTLMEQMNDPDNPLSGIMRFAQQIAGVQGTSKMTNIIADHRVEFSPDSRWLVTERARNIDAWDLSSGTLIPLPLGLARPAAFSRNGRMFASVGFDPAKKTEGGLKLSLRETGSLTVERDIDISGEPQQIVFASDASSVAIMIGSGIKVFETKTGDLLHSFTVGDNSTGTGTFSPDGRFIAYGGKQMPQAMGMFPAGILSGANMSRNQAKEANKDMMKQMSEMLKKGSMNAPPAKYQIKLYDLSSGQQTAAIDVESVEPPPAPNQPQSMMNMETMTGDYHDFAFSEDASLIAVQDYDQQYPAVKIYTVPSGQLQSTIRLSSTQAKPTGTMDIGKLLKTRPRYFLAFSPDRRMLAVTIQEGGYAVRLYNLQDGKIVREIKSPGRVDALNFSPNGRAIVTLQQDGSRILWNAATGQKMATLVEFPGLNFTTEWLVTSPDGLFDGSPAACNQILWRFSPNTFDVAPVEVFFNEFYYPGLLGEVMAGKSPPAPRDITQIDRRQPQVKITSANSTTDKISERTVKLQIQITDTGSGARDLRLFRNGSLVKVWHGDVAGSIDATVPIVAGDNRFVAYAFSRTNIKSADSALDLQGADTLRTASTAHVLAIGINQYANDNFNLKFAVPDAQAFGENLRAAITKAGSYASTEVTYLLDQDATKANILAALEKLKETVRPEDSIFVYYAGHGTAEGSRFYLVPHDLGYSGAREGLDDDAMKSVLANSISDLELQEKFEGIDAGEIVLLIDACNSGQALESEEKRRGLMNSRGLAQLAYEKGMYVLAAAQGYQAAIEAAELGHGYLTYTLVEEGLKTAAADKSPQDGQVWIREWLDYSTLRVPEMQSSHMEQARLLKHEVAFVEGEEKMEDLAQRNLQRPRVFYRREPEINPLVIAKP